MKKLYLAYGSNLSEEQMAYRCPDAQVIGTAEIKDYELLFKGSLTGSYATIEKKEGSSVPVAVWTISERDERNLDMYEGYPRFYYKQDMDVEMKSLETGENMGTYTAMVYIMDERRRIGSPSVGYYEVLADGYERFGFDKDILHKAVMTTVNALQGA